MKVYDVINDLGIMTGFKINMMYTGRFLLKVLKSCPSVSNIRRRSFFDKVRWYFQYCGVNCVIVEDVDMLAVFPEEIGGLSFKELQDLKEHFAKHESYALYILYYTVLIIALTSIFGAIIGNLIDHHWL